MSSEIPRHWRLKQQRYNLVGQKWGDQYVFPPRLVPPPVTQESDLIVIDGEIKFQDEGSEGPITISLPKEVSTSSK